MRSSAVCRAAPCNLPQSRWRDRAAPRAGRPAPIAQEGRTGDNRAMQREGRRLEFGWFLPTAGDTTAYGLASAQVAPSLPLFDRVVAAAEAAGFEYMLVPVQTACWEAWVSSAMMVGRSRSIRMLVAARPSYINPVDRKSTRLNSSHLGISYA